MEYLIICFWWIYRKLTKYRKKETYIWMTVCDDRTRRRHVLYVEPQYRASKKYAKAMEMI